MREQDDGQSPVHYSPREHYEQEDGQPRVYQSPREYYEHDDYPSPQEKVGYDGYPVQHHRHYDNDSFVSKAVTSLYALLVAISWKEILRAHLIIYLSSEIVNQNLRYPSWKLDFHIVKNKVCWRNYGNRRWSSYEVTDGQTDWLTYSSIHWLTY